MPAPPRTGQGLQPGSAAARRYANMARNLSQLQTQLASATGPQRDTIQRAITRLQGEMNAIQRPGLAPAPPTPAPPTPAPPAPTPTGGEAPAPEGGVQPPRPAGPGGIGSPDKGGGGYNVGDLDPEPQARPSRRDKAGLTGLPPRGEFQEPPLPPRPPKPGQPAVTWGGPQQGGPQGPPPAHGVLFSLQNDPAVMAHINAMLPQWARDAGVDALGYLGSVANRPVQDGLSRWILNQVNTRLQAQGYQPITDWSQSRGYTPPPGGGGTPPPNTTPPPGGGGDVPQPGPRGGGQSGSVPYGPGSGQMTQSNGPFVHPSMSQIPAGVTPPPGAVAYRMGANGPEFRIRGPAGAVWIPYAAPAAPGGGSTDVPAGPPPPPPPPGGWLPGSGGGMGPANPAPEPGGTVGGAPPMDPPMIYNQGGGPTTRPHDGGGATDLPGGGQRYDPNRKLPPMTNTPPIYVPPKPVEEKFAGMNAPVRPVIAQQQQPQAQGGTMRGGRDGYPEGFGAPQPPGLDPEMIRRLQSRRV